MNRKKDLFFYNNNDNIRGGFASQIKRNKLKYDNVKIFPQNIAKPIKNISDAEGLDIAYKTPSGQYIYGNTLYLSGSRNAQDWYDDLTKIPTMLVNHSQKYKDAEKLLNSSAGLGVSHIVSHSLGGAVAQKLKQDYQERDFKITTYGSPDLSIKKNTPENISRYKNIGDPVSILDGAAKVIGASLLNPFEAHSYKNSPYVSGDTDGWVIGDTSKNSSYDPSNSAYTTPPIKQK